MSEKKINKISRHMIDPDYTQEIDGKIQVLSDDVTDVTQQLADTSLNAKGLDSSQIQAFVDSAKDGDTIIFPFARYSLGILIVKKNITLDFRNSLVKGTVKFENVSNATIKNANFYQGAEYAIWIKSSKNVVVDNISLEEYSSGINVDGTGGRCKNIQIRNIKSRNLKSSTIFTYASDYVYFEKVDVYNSVWGINIISSTNVYVDESVFVLDSFLTTPTSDPSYYDRATEHGIYCHKSKYVYVKNSNFKGWDKSSPSDCGVKMRNGSHYYIDNCVFEENGMNVAFYIQNDSVTSHHFLTDVIVSNCQFNESLNPFYFKNYTDNGAVMDIRFDSCVFKYRRHFQAEESHLELKNCVFEKGWDNLGYALKSNYFGCHFKTAKGSLLSYIGNISGSRTNVVDCIFYEWATDISGLSGNTLEINKAAVGLTDARNINFISNKFLQRDKRAFAFYGADSGRVYNVLLSGNVGGSGFWGYQTGGKVVSVVADNNTVYDGSISQTLITSLNNNRKIDTALGAHSTF